MAITTIQTALLIRLQRGDRKEQHRTMWYGKCKKLRDRETLSSLNFSAGREKAEHARDS